LLADWAPDVLDSLLDGGADPQDLALKLQGSRQSGDEDLVYLWARRPIIEWALRRAAEAELAVEIRTGVQMTGLLTSQNGVPRALGVAVEDGDPVRGDVVVDALGRYRCPPGWRRAAGEPTDSGAIYYCRYFELAEGVEHLDAPILNPRGDLGYMGFNTFRGDNRTFAVILLAPAADHELRVLRHEQTWRAACSAITPLDVMTTADYARPITDVMPMGGLVNVDRTGDPGVQGIIAAGDAFCHTDPAFAYACRLRSPTRRRWPTPRLKHPISTRSWSATGRTLARKPASGTRSPAPLTRLGLCAGGVSRRRSADETAAIRCSRSRAPLPLHHMMTWSSGAPSVASACWTAPPSSTRTTRSMTGSRRSSENLQRARRRRQARPVRSCSLA
jgi:hypothetical protein